MQRIGVLESTFLQRVRRLASLEGGERRFVAAAFLLARPVKLAIATAGFPAVLSWLARLPPRTAGHSGIGTVRGETLVRWGFRAAACETRSACLPRAVVQYLLHHALGQEPCLVVGVAKAATGASTVGLDWSLDAHAWVEDREGPRREPGFAPILTLTPSEGVVRPRPD